MPTPTSHELVKKRSNKQCEAMIMVAKNSAEKGEEVEVVWTRCGKRPIEVHHRLTRARGGDLLDAVLETYHLMALCPVHHRQADGDLARRSGLLIDGYVNVDGAYLVYEGTDKFLSGRYGPMVLFNLSKNLRSPQYRKRLRG